MAKQAEILKYSDDRALRDALNRAKDADLGNFDFCLSFYFAGKEKKGSFSILINRSSLAPKDGAVELHGEGWFWQYGNARAQYGALRARMKFIKGDDNSSMLFTS